MSNLEMALTNRIFDLVEAQAALARKERSVRSVVLLYLALGVDIERMASKEMDVQGELKRVFALAADTVGKPIRTETMKN